MEEERDQGDEQEDLHLARRILLPPDPGPQLFEIAAPFRRCRAVIRYCFPSTSMVNAAL